ncbi:hypothetical protein [Caulobacter phage KcrB]|nr:hypothetical protein RW_GP093c [Caulobacter phage RW]WCA46397.1 hypothetical protein [Caulobacter phage KcrB]WCD56332.1 hypothetical protein [Caulobacter phage RLK]WNV48124.1 hypothetical protein GB2A_gp092c [Caulobacter phage GB2A]
MARAKTVVTEAPAEEVVTEEAVVVQPVIETAEAAVEPIAETPAIADVAAFAKTASEMAAAPIDEWRQTWAFLTVIGLKYDGGLNWRTVGTLNLALNDFNAEEAVLETAKFGDFHTVLYLGVANSGESKLLFSTNRVDAPVFTCKDA